MIYGATKGPGKIKMQQTGILKGNILYSKTYEELAVCEGGFLVWKDGKILGVYSSLPDEYASFSCEDAGDKLIIPGLIDLHTHAPQYPFRGTGMDLELLEWLNTYTFSEEAKYADIAYAKKAYSGFTEDLKKSATTRACIFATMHRPATLVLMDLLEKSGLVTKVGKVNMDRNSPDYLCEESAEESAFETIEWIKDVLHRKYENTSPILTPRFIPSCSDELLDKLKMIQLRYELPVQSHLSENKSEIEWVKELCPDTAFYGDAYDRYGLFGADAPTIMAHCVYSDEDEQDRMKENGVFVAHCPESNMNLSSGIAPVRRFLNKGLQVGLGSDVAAGTTLNLFRAMAEAVRVSKLRWRLQDADMKPLSFEEVFYMATKGGGAFFGQAGSFEEGYEADVVILDDSRLVTTKEQTLRGRLERVMYFGDEREVFGKYVKGNKIL